MFSVAFFLVWWEKKKNEAIVFDAFEVCFIQDMKNCPCAMNNVINRISNEVDCHYFGQ